MAAASYPVAANASRASTTGRSRRRPPADAAVALARMRPPPAEHPQPQRPPGRTSGKAGRFAICECPRPTRVRLRTYCEPSGCIVRSNASIRIARCFSAAHRLFWAGLAVSAGRPVRVLVPPVRERPAQAGGPLVSAGLRGRAPVRCRRWQVRWATQAGTPLPDGYQVGNRCGGHMGWLPHRVSALGRRVRGRPHLSVCACMVAIGRVGNTPPSRRRTGGTEKTGGAR